MSDKHTLTLDYQVTQARELKRLKKENQRLSAHVGMLQSRLSKQGKDLNHLVRLVAQSNCKEILDRWTG